MIDFDPNVDLAPWKIVFSVTSALIASRAAAWNEAGLTINDKSKSRPWLAMKNYPSLYIYLHTSYGHGRDGNRSPTVTATDRQQNQNKFFGGNFKWLSCFRRIVMNGFLRATHEAPFLGPPSLLVRIRCTRNAMAWKLPSHSTSTKDSDNQKCER